MITTDSERSGASGYTLVEVVMALAIGALVAVALAAVTRTTLESGALAADRNALAREGQLAMERMVRSVGRSPGLLVPLVENPWTGHSEALRDPGVLALRLDPELDRDADGVADADNDADGLVDEDVPADASNDGMPGLRGIDDNGGGIPDFSFAGNGDDDETGTFGGSGEDRVDGLDNDLDGSIDEDSGADMNGDWQPGIAGVDDDGDGSVDEGDRNDDDEDGDIDEDWIDAVVYRLMGADLLERSPNLTPADGSDYTERVIAANVTAFRVERLPRDDRRADLVDISLTLGNERATLTLQTRVRVGGRL